MIELTVSPNINPEWKTRTVNYVFHQTNGMGYWWMGEVDDSYFKSGIFQGMLFLGISEREHNLIYPQNLIKVGSLIIPGARECFDENRNLINPKRYREIIDELQNHLTFDLFLFTMNWRMKPAIEISSFIPL